MTSPSQKQWLKIANHTRSKVNIGWFMDTLALPIVICSIITAIITLLLKRYWLEFDYQLPLITFACLTLILAFFTYTIARKKFETLPDALIRLESSMQLYSSLSTAHAGKTSWPIVPKTISSGIRWHLRRLLLPIIGSLILVASAFAINITPQIPPVPPAAPKAWQNLAADLNELKDKDIVQDKYIKEIENKLDELKQQPEDDWYSHQSLEATENLKQTHQHALNSLSRNLDKAEKSLSTLKKYSKNLTEAQKNKLLDQFSNAMKALEKGRMKPNKELLDQLKKINPKLLNNLTPEQLEKLRQNMRGMSNELKKQLRQNLPPKEGDKNQDTDKGEQPGGRETPFAPGQGEPNAEGGHQPKVLGDEAQDLQANRTEKLNSQNLENTLPGDLLETKNGGEHNVNKSKTSLQQGGNAANKGQGGDEVWKGNYLPKEKRALQNFFK